MVHRDRSEIFFASRLPDDRRNRESLETERVFNLYKMLSFQMLGGTSTTSKKDQRKSVINLLALDTDTTPSNCSRCGVSIGGMFRKIHRCNLCSAPVCDSCYANKLPVWDESKVKPSQSRKTEKEK